MSECQKSSNAQEAITTIHPHDVLSCSGRGSENEVYLHPGNINFRDLARRCKHENASSLKRDRSKLAKKIVDEIINKNPPGRFLKRKKKNTTGHWYDIGYKKALKKTKLALYFEDKNAQKEEQQRWNQQQVEAGVGSRTKKIPTTSSELHDVNPKVSVSTKMNIVQQWKNLKAARKMKQENLERNPSNTQTSSRDSTVEMSSAAQEDNGPTLGRLFIPSSSLTRSESRGGSSPAFDESRYTSQELDAAVKRSKLICKLAEERESARVDEIAARIFHSDSE